MMSHTKSMMVTNVITMMKKTSSGLKKTLGML